jgi:hypothetical protein
MYGLKTGEAVSGEVIKNYEYLGASALSLLALLRP